MPKNHAKHANQVDHAQPVDDSKPNQPADTTAADRYADLAAELDDLAATPTNVLADWVAARGRCLWETTFGDPPDWLTSGNPDRELATRLCAGCPVRAECLEFELRVAGDSTVGVWPDFRSW